jgi:SAM-dependent methyltransferase
VLQDESKESSAVPCAVCGNRATTGRPPKQHRAHHNDETYTLYCCSACQLQFWWPLKADPSVYENEGFDAYSDYHAGKRPFPRWAEPLFVRLPSRRAAALDIGCGDGSVLSRLAQAGFAPHGIDLDAKSVLIARTKFGLQDVGTATLGEYTRECMRTGQRFGLITFFEVLEHQDAPREFLAQVTQLADPGATVAGSVPNRARFLAALDRKLSDGDFPPHHFLWFSEQALQHLFEKEGLQVVRITKVGALPYWELTAKLRAAVEYKRKAWPRFGQLLLSPVLKALSPFAALVPWLGMRLAPPRLYFECRVRTSP